MHNSCWCQTDYIKDAHAHGLCWLIFSCSLCPGFILYDSLVADLACSWPDLGFCFWPVANSWPGSVPDLGFAHYLVPCCPPVQDPGYSCDHADVSDPGFLSCSSAYVGVCCTSSVHRWVFLPQVCWELSQATRPESAAQVECPFNLG